jgi:hypothetical protein
MLMRLRAWLGVVALLVAGCRGVSPALAQEPTPQHAAEIRLGSCAGLGETAAALTPLAEPAGDRYGQPDATPVQQSVTVVPQALMDLIAAGSAVVVYDSPDQSGSFMACGDVGGVLGAGGSLTVGLNPFAGTPLTGTATLAPTAPGDGTLVTVLMVDTPPARERRDEPASDVATSPDAAESAASAPVADGNDGAAGNDGADGRDGADGKDGQPGQPGEDGGKGGKGGKGGDGGRGGKGARGGDGGDGGDGGAGGRGGDGGDGGDANG